MRLVLGEQTTELDVMTLGASGELDALDARRLAP
jgi:hypothetical protein